MRQARGGFVCNLVQQLLASLQTADVPLCSRERAVSCPQEEQRPLQHPRYALAGPPL